MGPRARKALKNLGGIFGLCTNTSYLCQVVYSHESKKQTEHILAPFYDLQIKIIANFVKNNRNLGITDSAK